MGTKPPQTNPGEGTAPAENVSTPDIEKSEIIKPSVAEEVEGGLPEASLSEDPIEGRKVLRKIDLRVVPLLIFIYVLCFLDRLNIGKSSSALSRARTVPAHTRHGHGP